MALNKFKKLVNPLINYLGQKKAAAKFSEPPILIGGCGRSGTTLLLSILGSHPKIFAFDKEITTFANWEKGDQGQLIPQRRDRFYRALLFNRIPSLATRWCEKTPRNVLHFEKILDYFNGQVQLIHIVRDGRDVMLSQHPTEPDEYWVTPKRWVRDVKAGLKFKDHPQVLTIKYENLILEYKQTVEKLCNFLEEECPAEIYEWRQHTNVQDSKAWSDSVQKLHTKSIAKWKQTEDQARVQEVISRPEVRELLSQLGYEVEEE